MPRTKASAAARLSVTIASEWPVEQRSTCSIASSTRADRAHGQDEVEVLGRPVLLVGGARSARRARPRASRVGAQLDAARRQLGADRAEQRERVAVHDQRLGRVAHAGALRLRVDDDRERLGRIGVGVQVHVAVAAGGDEHGTRAVLEQELLEPLAAARDDDVAGRGVGDEGRELLARRLERDDGVLGQAGRREPCAHAAQQDGIRVRGRSSSRAGAQAFPLLRQRPATSTVTLGRAS